jgi:predicted amidohydrolase
VDEKEEGYDFKGFGFSTIYGPNGKILSQAKEIHKSEIVYAEIPIQKK